MKISIKHMDWKDATPENPIVMETAKLWKDFKVQLRDWEKIISDNYQWYEN